MVRQVDLGEAVSVEDLAEAPVAEAEPVVDKCIIRARLKNTLLFSLLHRGLYVLWETAEGKDALLSEIV